MLWLFDYKWLMQSWTLYHMLCYLYTSIYCLVGDSILDLELFISETLWDSTSCTIKWTSFQLFTAYFLNFYGVLRLPFDRFSTKSWLSQTCEVCCRSMMFGVKCKHCKYENANLALTHIRTLLPAPLVTTFTLFLDWNATTSAPKTLRCVEYQFSHVRSGS